MREKNSLDNDFQYKIFLVSGYDSGVSIRDLLFNNKAKIFSKIGPKEFVETYHIITNKYPDLISKIVCDVFTGNFQRTFDQYLKTTEIDEAYFANSLQYSNENGKFDPFPFLRKTTLLEAQQVKMQSQELLPEKGKIAEVFVEV